MKAKYLFTLIICLVLQAFAGAQTFERLYGGAGDDRAYSVVQTPDGGFVMAGYTESFALPNSATPRDGYVVKTDANGVVQWSKTFGTAGANEDFREIIQTSDGGFIAVGSASNLKKTYAVKMTALGALTWSNTFDVSTASSDNEGANNVIQAADGNFVIGCCVGSPSFNAKSAVLKIDATTGSLIWFNDYNGTTNLGTGIVELDDASLMTVTSTTQTTAGLYDYSMTHLNSTGTLGTLGSVTGAKNYGGDGDDGSYDLIRTADGGYMMSGGTSSYDSVPMSTPVGKNLYIKTDANGDYEWAYLIHMYGRSQRCFSVIQATDCTYVSASFDLSPPSNFYVYTFDGIGLLGWSRSFGNSLSDDVCYSLIQTSDNGFAVIGYSNDAGGHGGYDFFLVKTDFEGNVEGACDQDDLEPFAAEVFPVLHQRSITVNGPLPQVPITTAEGSPTIVATPPACPGPDANFASNDTLICLGDCISFTDLSTGSPTSWSWSFPGSSTPTSTDQNPIIICYDTAGIYPVTLVISNAFGSDSVTSYITVFSPPAPLITAGGDLNLCNNEVIFLFSNYTEGNWWLPTEMHDPYVIVSTAGTYTLTVTDENGCSGSDTITLTSENCCFAEGNSLFTQINSNMTISTNTVWANKYYIAPGVIVTVDNAELDITNVDVVFGECAGMDFVNGANLRANNSVFRTCDEFKSWRGLTFTGSRGVINECEFKNAFIAAMLYDENPVRFTNNMFLNCHNAIYITGVVNPTVYNESITGNTFTLDNTPIDYKDNGCLPTGGGIDYGIVSYNVYFGDVIAQNDFNYSAINTSNDKKYIGIYAMLGKGGKISSNHFSNMYRSMDFAGVSTFAVDNNIMEITTANTNNTFQIRIGTQGNLQTTTMDVRNNTMTCNASTANNPNHSAIYLQKATSSNITGNSITGFETAITALNVNNTNITENIITDSKLFGISITNDNRFNATHLDVSCNEIRMDLSSNSTQVVGIFYFQNSITGNRGLSIRNNCILQTTHAILLNTNTSSPIPNIVGNYMYNYTRFGVLSQNFTGSIGTSLTQAGAGKNTFVSNNIPNGAWDIASVGPLLISYANHGAFSLSNVMPSGTNMYHSIAYCGNQIGTVSSQIGIAEICTDPSNTFRIAQTENGIATLSNDYETMLMGSGETYFTTVVSTLQTLSTNSTVTEQDRLYNTVVSQHRLNATEAALFYHYYLVSIRRYNDALANLPSLSGVDHAGEFIEVQRIQLGLFIQHLSPVSLSGNDLASLELIAADTDSYVSRAATDLLQAAMTRYDYNFDEPMQIEDVSVTGELFSIEESQLYVYPNPAGNTVTIQYVTETPDACELRITDVTGRIVFVKPLGYNQNQEQIDISNLNSGVYLVTLYENNTPVVNEKLVKE